MNLVSAEYHRTTGLGNKLFPWARAQVLARRLGCLVLDSRWLSLRRGALLRGGINYRTVLHKTWLADNFRRDPQAVDPAEYRRHYRKLSVEWLDNLPGPDWSAEDGRHYCFRWCRFHNFADLWAERDFIRSGLRRIARHHRERYLAEFENRDFIALNIRTGKDFKHKSSNEVGYYLTELDWFVMALAKARQKYGNLPAVVVSDGGPRHLEPILTRPDVNLVRTVAAVDDLRILLNARVLLGSGNSSFSAWAAFLGGMDTYSSADTPFDHFAIVPPGSDQIVSVW